MCECVLSDTEGESEKHKKKYLDDEKRPNKMRLTGFSEVRSVSACGFVVSSVFKGCCDLLFVCFF